jgi:3-deoxy-D-manno-octulosonic-acid transferase
MNLFLYTFFLRLYTFVIHIVALWNHKAKQWTEGRKNIFNRIEEKIRGNTAPLVWFHSASLGEFEQARPVIEQFRIHYPSYKIFLTFFSPSGYEIRKNYAQADYVFYLPMDSKSNARKFIRLVKPNLVLFAKYEFWHYYITELAKNEIPTLSFSAIFRPDQIYFKPYARFYKKILKELTHIFVQNQESFELLQQAGITQVSVAGDTRFDRVQTVAAQKKSIPLAEAFKHGQKLLVIGSSWPQDMERIIPFLNAFTQPLKVIIAPHELHESEIEQLTGALTKKTVRFSQAQIETVAQFDVLLIDNIGMLSSLYQYGEFAYIGGAFGKGLHNILEAATFGMPIFFGPNHRKFQEALDLIALQGAFPIATTAELSTAFTPLYQHENQRMEAAQVTRRYVEQNTGATEQIIKYCKKWM